MIELFPESEPPKPSLLKVGKNEWQFPLAASEIQIVNEQGQLLWQKQRDSQPGPIRWKGVDTEGKVLEAGDYVCKLVFPDGRKVDVPVNLTK